MCFPDFVSLKYAVQCVSQNSSTTLQRLPICPGLRKKVLPRLNAFVTRYLVRTFLQSPVNIHYGAGRKGSKYSYLMIVAKGTLMLSFRMENQQHSKE